MPRKPHAIEQVKFSRGQLTCHCGWQAEQASPAGLALQYQAHRRIVGLAGTDSSDIAVSGQAATFTIRTRRHK